jgi:hypothetical protein
MTTLQIRRYLLYLCLFGASWKLGEEVLPVGEESSTGGEYR